MEDVMRVEPYLFFDGRCEEAIEFYRRALGAEVTALVRFKDGGVPGANQDKVMHAALSFGGSSVLLSDGQCRGQPEFRGFSLSLNAGSTGDAQRFFDALAQGGRIQVPLAPTPFASRFGMVADSFGVTWTVVCQQGAA
jgi:PhnB protein